MLRMRKKVIFQPFKDFRVFKIVAGEIIGVGICGESQSSRLILR